MRQAAAGVLLTLGASLGAACGGDDTLADELCRVVPGPAGAPARLGEGPMCTHLASYRLFADLGAQAPADGVEAYDLATPLFSDYALKRRFIWLPDGAAAPMTWSDVDTFTVPVGAVIVKTFSMPHDLRAPAAGERLLETRVLVHRSTGWEGASYVYPDGSELGGAVDDALLTAGARTLDVTFADDAGSHQLAYGVPSKNECKNCHEEHAEVMGPIGPKARHLNRDAVAPASGNQLAGLIAAGHLVGAPADPATWPRTPRFDDAADGTLEARARGWLDINCAHCHNPTGPAITSGLDLSIGQLEPYRYGVCKPPVAAGQGSGGRRWGIVPGQPDASILVYRLEATAADVKMPELGRTLVHAEGVALVRAWISSLTGDCDAVR